jgi:hypothetical protein
MCFAAMVTVWSLSVSLAISFMTSPKFSRISSTTDKMCISSTNNDDQNVLLYVGVIGVLLYFISMALYGHMYLDVRKTNQKTAQLQRENRLARRIAVIMFTNVLFFILPLIATSAINFPPLTYHVSSRVKSIFWGTCAVTCLGINSCLNPILFSFRNETFRNEFRKRILPFHNSIDIDQ